MYKKPRKKLTDNDYIRHLFDNNANRFIVNLQDELTSIGLCTWILKRIFDKLKC